MTLPCPSSTSTAACATSPSNDPNLCAQVMAEAGGKALLDRVQLVEALAQLRKAGDAETAQVCCAVMRCCWRCKAAVGR